jgi:hypothetical protein
MMAVLGHREVVNAEMGRHRHDGSRLSLSLLLISAGCDSKSSNAATPNAKPAPHQAALEGGSLSGGEQNALNGGPGLGDDPSPIPFEEQEWNIVAFTDPRSGETYDIIDGRVIVALTNPPLLPQMPFDYFDVERPPTDPYYLALQGVQHPCAGDSAVSAFVAAENLEVYSEWPMVGSIAVALPQGETVLDAVTRWPQQYPLVVAAADPDSLVDSAASAPPNDAYFPGQWALNSVGSTYNIHWLEAWQAGIYGNSNTVIAVVDSGVEYDLTDLRSSSTPIGCNVYERWRSTCFFPRTQNGGGEPDDSSKNRDPEACGHGTCVASIIAATANNNSFGTWDGTEIAGVASGAKYYPIAMERRHQRYPVSATLNGINAVGVTKGLFTPGRLYSGIGPTYYNIKIANCSFEGKYDTTIHRLIKAMSPYIVFVCAAGNHGNGVENGYPAGLTRFPDLAVISVAAYDINGNRSIWGTDSSNYALNTSIAAPGTNIRALDIMGSSSANIPLGYIENPYTVHFTFKGTSASAPFVAGAAALVIARFPQFTPMQIKAQLLTHALELPDPVFRARNIRGLNVFASL